MCIRDSPGSLPGSCYCRGFPGSLPGSWLYRGCPGQFAGFLHEHLPGVLQMAGVLRLSLKPYLRTGPAPEVWQPLPVLPMQPVLLPAPAALPPERVLYGPGLPPGVSEEPDA